MLVRNRVVRDARVQREARSLAAAGYDVTVLALSGAGLPRREGIAPGFTVLRAVDPGRLAGPSIASDSTAEANPARRGATLRRALGRPGALVWLRDRTLTARFTRAAADLDAEVFHAHDLNTLAAATEGARGRAKLVFDAHELYPELTGLGRSERARWAALERRLIGRADAVVVPSESRADEMARRYAIAQPVVVMNCPPASASPDPAHSLLHALRRDGERLAVYAGGYAPNRGLENLMRAIDHAPGWRLAMLGWGPLEGTLRSIAGDRVVFVPPVPADEVVAAAAGADVGVASYLPIGLNNVLAAPNKLFEYLHAGLAVAASDLPDIRAVVERHSVGALFDAADPRSIAAALIQLGADEERLARMRRASREAAPAYTWEAQERALLELYGRLAPG
jgi:glycosyltransferase involved in cell wall biosynthesis